ncbi:hypothetical protein BEP19_03375 [Ammoniphilus oxalaticus]|uniref:Uncharacterized protein n=1 Tax=Ammoniphilus oxalaticus TaxID=66863 RepID=A0A419SP24_9BACL|nr:hypothetical protein [Ammoniphilus oxalaticus]RKD25979.1 hypothetical protein BEP19_03375 [Ammoniphilus oxalaticus]
MKAEEVKKMRFDQLIVVNGLILTVVTIYLILANVLHITVTSLFLVIGAIALIQGVAGLVRMDEAKSIIPIFGQVAAYEKEKLGDQEWRRQRIVGCVWNAVVSGIFLIQAYMHRGSLDTIAEIDYPILLIFVFLALTVLNFSMLMHFRKIDHAEAKVEFNYSMWRAQLDAVLIIVTFGFVMFTFTVFYFMTVN